MLFRSICKLFNTSRVSAYQFYSTKPLISSFHSFDELEAKIVWDNRDPTTPVTPILNQWVQDGGSITHLNIQYLIACLCRRRCYTHALELSEWMRESKKYDLTPADIAKHLKLLSIVRGLEQTENFYEYIPNSRMKFKINVALAECYAEHKSLEKAEALLKKMRKIYPMNSPMRYNKMLKLYAELGKYDKLDSLMQEMMEKDIRDPGTYTILLNAYVVAADIQGIDKLLIRMEVDPLATVRWHTYAIAANGYLKGGNVQKALSALKKSEQLALGNPVAYLSILTIYAGIGNKDEVYRIWGKCKLSKRFYNQGHFLMLRSLVKLGDIVGAEKILEEWESNYKVFDIRIPHPMIHIYCKLGMLDKAEAYIKSLLDSGQQLHAAEHDCADNNMEKAVQAMNTVPSAERTSWMHKPFVFGFWLNL
ncbi:pentatricopeptide repeat-containing protein At2g20710, mitochondrial-like isoform X1 [Arachis stenosperma]|uniref:pentatricopeptide repeat-containing protein At2g20710, mitochondrial-like isoform X1 n=2 Tax=Arachis stenosperma TaxID=217475 RepID=UPI0025AB72D2|nr:pentatricopeptide repeat-containing protein At2g20710, mitochondrial-like isoform X1 [Arachis stenosperma]XP_057727880.1 pentatricopeptide repeat-containing protein At2g20710, mitochondrial-like isoform X1 [Arachis stenosperma]XP_057727881.1 pentatricopeptide repeat-containing protein At2g20710, mitochondrial-like isoform X1 [Arachis stenosperma]XP_057727882.1 pentatricopeptide repeat-containing protein At2g20710, mitochondrial-like isoform X1 [Arachis stenosperma]XP_057727883.1 pentatricope